MLSDIARALGQLGDRRFLGVVFKSVLITIVLLAAAVWATLWALGLFLPDSLSLPIIGTIGLGGDWISWAALGVLLLLSVVLMVPVASVFVSFFLDSVVDAVEARHYPDLPPVTPMPFSDVAIDAVRFLILMIVVNGIALIIYLLSTVLAPVIFWIVNGLLLGREYFHLVASRRLGREGANQLRKEHFLMIWATGILMALPLTIPVVNLFVPVLGVAAFTHQYHRVQRGR